MEATGELGRKLRVVQAWALRHAERSQEPGEYLDHFEGELEALLIGANLVETRWTILDPVHMAAEIEALCAHRAVRNWGTDHGLCYPRGSRVMR